MSVRCWLMAAVVTVWAMGGVVRAEEAGAATRPAADVAAVSDAANRFAFDLYTQLAGERKGNLAVSPLSVAMTLSMLRSSAEGQTAAEMDRVLHVPVPIQRWHATLGGLVHEMQQRDGAADAGEAMPLKMASAVWHQRGLPLRDPFAAVLRRDYRAAAAELDFKQEDSLEQINRWVAEQTGGRIADLLNTGQDREDLRLVVVNTMLFKARWQDTFQRGETRPGTFTTLEGGKVQVPFMHANLKFASLVEDETTQAVSLQLLSERSAPGRFEMVLVVPRRADGLHALEQQLTGKTVPLWLERLQRWPAEAAAWEKKGPPAMDEAKLHRIISRVIFNEPEPNFSDKLPADDPDLKKFTDWWNKSPVALVELAIPRFAMESHSDIAEATQHMGIRRAFAPGAELHPLAEPIYISHIRHKARVAIDEQGVEAAAGTEAGGAFGGPMARQVVLTVDRPFLFLIREVHSGVILVIGRVADPSGDAK